MGVLRPGTPVPAFELRTEDGGSLGTEDLEGRTTVLVFFPYAFSGVCSEQFQIYQEVLDEIRARGADVYGVSCDAHYAQRAWREWLNVDIPMLSDFEPKGAVARALGVFWHPWGAANRALVVIGPDRVVRWSWEGDTPDDLPGANLIFDGLDAVPA